MIPRRTATVILVGLLIILTAGEAGRVEGDVVDKIAAVVGNEVILASELANQIQLTAFQSGHRPQTEEEMVRFQKQILEQMISDKL